MKQFAVAVVCGGPSLERGISLNSARSLVDHLNDDIEIIVIYINKNLEYFLISKSQLYSNTPLDFDFKLTIDGRKLSENEVIDELAKVKLVFPAIHGAFGEDGKLQKMLEDNNIPFVGSGSVSCSRMFNKDSAARVLKQNNFHTIKSFLVTAVEYRTNKSYIEHQIREFLLNNSNKSIVKPNAGGSSIGVFIADSVDKAIASMETIFLKGIDNTVIIEEFCFGKEFTVIVLQDKIGEPVALIPSQIVITTHACVDDHGVIFDYRRKYLPTSNTRHICPPNLSDDIVSEIMFDAERIFKIFDMKDFVRIDGWVLNDGRIVFSDLNPISGMEQNSFLFKQGAHVGMTHHDILQHILQNACRRHGITLQCNDWHNNRQSDYCKKNVYVVFGGKTAERQVSVMSGVNVWLKLLKSKIYNPIPCFLDENSDVWIVPYAYNLFHTAEEIYENCITANDRIVRLLQYSDKIHSKLCHKYVQNNSLLHITWCKFLERVKCDNAFLFLALHGGDGENGTIQSQLEVMGIKYNGSNSVVSKLCMDKYATSCVLQEYISVCSSSEALQLASHITFLPKILCRIADNELQITSSISTRSWDDIKNALNCSEVIIKPSADGCSTGIARLSCEKDIEIYIRYLTSKLEYIPTGTLSRQSNIIELPQYNMHDTYILEPYIETDRIILEEQQLHIEKKYGWIEMTVGVLENKDIYHSFNPSITVSEYGLLTLEEKFQGGTGINLTPPPSVIVSETQLHIIKKTIELVAKILGIQNYARIDIFFNCIHKQIIIIEVNSLPALTPSTVIFHQALAEQNSMYPLQFLEAIIAEGLT